MSTELGNILVVLRTERLHVLSHPPSTRPEVQPFEELGAHMGKSFIVLISPGVVHHEPCVHESV